MRLSVLLVFMFVSGFVNGQVPTTRFERSDSTQTPTYQEIIDWWRNMDEESSMVKMLTMGITDAGYPLNLVIVSGNSDTDLGLIRRRNKRIILINNGIHPGEPDGIDASMLLVRDIVIGKYKLPSNIALAIIPVYNIGGCLNRSADYRVDQNGPEEFGFRGNSENYDLNRDFIKADSKDARAFAEIFHLLDPDVFVDNHVSDGADYQHVMTLLTSQHNKLGGVMGEFMYKRFEPGIWENMKQKGYDLIPYVNFWGSSKVEDGWQEFWDSPRYGSGYASLFNCFAFVPETHMLKPYGQRVHSTYALMLSFIEFTSANSEQIRATREAAKRATISASSFPVRWKADRSASRSITFRGFESGYRNSDISGLPRLYYDRNKPYTKEIPFYDGYTATDEIKKPKAYIIPQGWWKVIELLKLNKVRMQAFRSDTTIEVEVYHIEDFKAGARPYEGHHMNTEVKVRTSIEKVRYRKGDFLVPMNQAANRFLIETLEPQAEDSYFAWNFFDPILSQKEGYSAYSFEDIAADYLKQNPELRKQLEEKKAGDSSFANNASAQLNYVYQNSIWFEPAYLRYPVTRIN
ncbi:MAG: M14 family metallopeptidase [Chitinophagaceae bacterium]